MILRLRIVLKRTVVGDWRFDNLSGSHLPAPYKRLMYQSNQSFNISPPGNPPGIWIFGKFLFKSPPPPEAEKLFKCPIIGPFQVIKCRHPLFGSFYYAPEAVYVNMVLIDRETTLLHAKDKVNGSWIPSNTEQSLCKPLLFSQSATNRVSFALNAWSLSSPWFITPRGISATRNMKSRLAIKCPTPNE